MAVVTSGDEQQQRRRRRSRSDVTEGMESGNGKRETQRVREEGREAGRQVEREESGLRFYRALLRSVFYPAELPNWRGPGSATPCETRPGPGPARRGFLSGDRVFASATTFAVSFPTKTAIDDFTYLGRFIIRFCHSIDERWRA